MYAPNPGGRQGTKIIILDDPKTIEQIGIVNANCENRNWDFTVSKEQPSIIDDKSIKSGFYGCPALYLICNQKERKTQVNQIGAAFVCAQNMALAAYEMGLGTCIVGRAEATFENPLMQELLNSWGLDPLYTPIIFVCAGYVDGEYPAAKPRYEGRVLYVGEDEQG